MSAQTITTLARPKLPEGLVGRRSPNEVARPRRISTAKAAAGKSAPAAPVIRPRSQSRPVRKEIVFRLDAPAAGRVALAADFTNWDKGAINMSRGLDGVWQTKIQLEEGRHCYKFLVDGEWRDDPNCPVRQSNPFGGSDAVLEVL